jgi:hypothetical protein
LTSPAPVALSIALPQTSVASPLGRLGQKPFITQALAIRRAGSPQGLPVSVKP